MKQRGNLENLIAPFVEHEFMLHALIAGILFAVSASWVGFFLSLRKMSLAGDAMSHALLPGIGISFMLFGASSLALFLGGLAMGLFMSLVLGLTQWGDQLTSDRRLSSFLTTLSALGTLLLGFKLQSSDLHQILFGSLLSIGETELRILVSVFVTCSFCLMFFRRELFFETLDPLTFHRVSRYGRGMRFLLFFLTTLVLSAGVSFLGALLVIGLLIIPAAIAQECFSHWRKVMLSSAVFALLSVYVGLLLSFHLDLLPGPAVVSTAGLLFILVFIGKKIQCWLV